MVLTHKPTQQEAKMSFSNITMAAFSSQVSNLSALTSAIGSFSRILEVSDEYDANQTGKLRGVDRATTHCADNLS
jgi:hypothetical protein